ncbi:putative xyloglucan endotransglucosylase/hydrolase protein 30 [Canna indica]|uniref:Xyloglucan endotransglucosylase/hydrolase n=1 Tax=Canna indica TaxID=4628 RepID=A0AAQ3QR30_9LILI|nr:putative xyloglucan endotransglucosylase/hydrolase protein 30 [Canna indica]
MQMNPSILLPLAFLVVAAAAGGATAFNVPTLAFSEGYMELFGDGNLVRSADDRSVSLLLDRYSGISSNKLHAQLIQLLPNEDRGSYRPRCIAMASSARPSSCRRTTPPASSSPFTRRTRRVLRATEQERRRARVYTSNGDVFEKTHDELDFEFLGNIRGKAWRVQTNVYGNGSTSRGREERYFLPFDPAADFHRYSILWTSHKIIFYIDETPIREVRRSEAMGGDYPSKPMSLYATIWDASSWATSGGMYKVDYAYAPFVAEYTDLTILGCRTDLIEEFPSAVGCTAADADLAATGLSVMTPERRRAMQEFRERHMTYSFCYDVMRYPTTEFPDCDNMVESEREKFRENGHVKYVSQSPRRRARRRSRIPAGSRSKARKQSSE